MTHVKSSVTPVKVRILEPHSTKSATGQVEIQFWDKSDRTKRALKLGGMCWGGALVSVIFPLVHFFLVPGLLIAGPVLAFFTFEKERMILGGTGKCPKCEKDLPIARATYRFPFSDLCTLCQTSLKVELDSP